MQNLFMPSETIACIEQKYVGKTYRTAGKAYSEPLTKDKIKSLFEVYVTSLDNVFGGRAIVMQRTRATKGGTVVPATSYEYVYKNKQSISSYTNEGYYAVTINGYRVSDIIDSGMHMFYDSINGARKIIDDAAAILNIDVDATRGVFEKFFFDSGMQNFDAFLSAIVANGKVDIFHFDVCSSLVCSFGEPLPAIASATDIQVMSRQAQDQGFAVDEVDVDGWKDEKTRDPAARRVAFHDFFDSVLKHTTDPQPIDDVEEKQNDDNGYSRFDVDKPDAPQYCWKEADDCPPTDDDKDAVPMPERFVDNKDDLSEIRKDVDARDTAVKKNDEPSKDETVDISTASDGNNYTYSITWTDKDGKPQTKTFYGEAAKKMMSKPNKEEKTDEKRVDSWAKLGDIIDRIEKRLSRLEDNIDRPVRIRRPKPFDRINELFYDNDLFGGMRDLFGGF